MVSVGFRLHLTAVFYWNNLLKKIMIPKLKTDTYGLKYPTTQIEQVTQK
jgi:hypothetical protein